MFPYIASGNKGSPKNKIKESYHRAAPRMEEEHPHRRITIRLTHRNSVMLRPHRRITMRLTHRPLSLCNKKNEAYPSDSYCLDKKAGGYILEDENT
jgi:hypothetical protein